MNCPSCGTVLRDNAVFCSSCGARITQQTMQVRVPPREERAGGGTGAAPGGSAIDEGLARMQTPGAGPQDLPPPPPGGQQFGGPPPGQGPAGQGGGAFGGPPPGGGGQFGGAPPPRGGYAGPGAGAMPGARTAAAGPNFNRVIARIAPLLRLDTSVFRELYRDQSALIPSIVLAAVSILIMSFGAWLWWWIEADSIQIADGISFDAFDEGRYFVRSVIIGTILGTAMWVAWVAIAGVVLTQVFKRNAEPMALLPALGLATIPFVFGLLMLVDGLRQAAGIGAVAGVVALMQIGIQETTDASPGEAFAANMLGFLAFALVLGLLGGSDRDLAPGIWLFS